MKQLLKCFSFYAGSWGIFSSLWRVTSEKSVKCLTEWRQLKNIRKGETLLNYLNIWSRFLVRLLLIVFWMKWSKIFLVKKSKNFSRLSLVAGKRRLRIWRVPSLAWSMTVDLLMKMIQLFVFVKKTRYFMTSHTHPTYNILWHFRNFLGTYPHPPYSNDILQTKFGSTSFVFSSYKSLLEAQTLLFA